jgi:hypothetical protein
VPVTPGETLYVNVGGEGGNAAACCGGAQAPGGFNGGGLGGQTATDIGGGGGGGGATDLREGGSALTNRIVVAGGGGGGGGYALTTRDQGGSGGGLTGQSGDLPTDNPGWGGSQTAGGAGGAATAYGSAGGDGSLGVGGAAGAYGAEGASAGGGGGGYYGGGGGGGDYASNGGGGGGSNYVESTGSIIENVQGFTAPGNGSLTITYPPGVTPPSPTSGVQPYTTPGTYNWPVPAGVTSILVDVYGAAGGGGLFGGAGGRTLAVVPVVAGENLQVDVGGEGSTSGGGYNGGGNPGSSSVQGGGGGSDVRVGGSSNSSRAATAGGGGGAGGNDPPQLGVPGGAAGGTSGMFGGDGIAEGGGSTTGGGGGTLTGPGAAGTASTYSFGGNPGFGGAGGNGNGGCRLTDAGGGGGGGYFGGGSGGATCYGNGGGGGGGSSFAIGSQWSTVAGWNPGTGAVVIYYPASTGVAYLNGHPELTSEQRGACSCDDLDIPVPTAGAPVNLGTGFQTETVTDLATPGRGPALAFRRTYNSDLAAQDGPLGLGWTDSYNLSLTFGSGTPPSTVTVNEETGGQIVFDYNTTTSTYAPDVARDQATLVEGSGTWTFARYAKSIFDFNSTGQLVDEKDLNGNITTVGPVSGGTQVITDPAGRTYTLTYSGTHITSVAEEAGGSYPARTVSYGYTGSLLTSVTDVNGGITDYGYDSSNRLAVERTPRFASNGALPAAPTSCSGTATLDSTGTVYDTTTPGHVLCQWDALGRQTTFAYTFDGSGNVTQTIVTRPQRQSDRLRLHAGDAGQRYERVRLTSGRDLDLRLRSSIGRGGVYNRSRRAHKRGRLRPVRQRGERHRRPRPHDNLDIRQSV